MQLRSGVIKDAPKRKHISAYQVFYKERSQPLKQKGLKVGDIQAAVAQEWNNLSSQEEAKYYKIFEDNEKKYTEDLVLYYGGTQQDVRKLQSFEDIPEKPRKPASGCLAYIAEMRQSQVAKDQDLNGVQITKKLADMYSELPSKERAKYEDAFEKGMKVYHKEMELWSKKYGAKSEVMDQFMEEKFKRSAQRDELEYQELKREKRVRKLKDEEGKDNMDNKKDNMDNKKDKPKNKTDDKPMEKSKGMDKPMDKKPNQLQAESKRREPEETKERNESKKDLRKKSANKK